MALGKQQLMRLVDDTILLFYKFRVPNMFTCRSTGEASQKQRIHIEQEDVCFLDMVHLHIGASATLWQSETFRR